MLNLAQGFDYSVDPLSWNDKIWQKGGASWG
jgi:hypothetical protein